ncbi:MAG: Acyl-CoA dehydrogenase [Turneriella sp.]|nr:Acyl-CoA dehydrogenase [Turneriella sp.]
MPQLTRFIAEYESAPQWEIDTKALPTALQAYRRKCRAFADKYIRPYALALDAQKDKTAEEEILVRAGKEGFLSDMLPWPLGSQPASVALEPLHWVQSLKMEEFCAACGGIGLLLGAHGLGMAPFILSGDLRMVFKYVLPINRENSAGVPHIAAFAITEPAAGSDVEETEGARVYTPGTTAKRTSGGWILNGRKVFISGGDIARTVTVFAAIEKEGVDSWTCFAVPKETVGFSVGRNELKMGQRASSATELIFEDAFVSDANVVGGVRGGWSLCRTVLNYSRIPVAAIALGIARGAFEAAIEFASKQKLGGQTLNQYQEVQLSLARMYTLTTAMRSTVWNLAAHWTQRQSHASAAKVFCSDTAMEVANLAMELMGNHGLFTHNLAEKAFRDARLTQIYEGTNQINLLGIIEDQYEDFFK